MTPNGPANSADKSAMMLFSLMMTLAIAVVLMVGAVGVVAVARGDSGAAAGPAYTTVNVTLTEFAIEYDRAAVPAGPVIFNVINKGSAEHNFGSAEVSKKTGNIAPGASATLKVDSYSAPLEFICDISGHAEAGMKATLGVGEDTGDHGATQMTNEQMDEAMAKVAKRFVEEEKPSVVGNTELEPEILADGTKVFKLTASIIDWEVEKGVFVKGWAYNEQIPGPVMRASVGDKIRIVLTNNLPESTSMHMHGIRVPNAADGVDPYTQDATKPGETHTYDFVAKETGVGMYHSHHNAQVQVPNGLAGALIVGDWKSIAMDVAGKRLKDADGKAEQEVMMVLNDAGTIGLSLNGRSFPSTQAYTLNVGETMVVHYFNEGLMSHPMHLHQPAGLVVAHDGKPLESPFWADTINVAPGERWTVAYTMLDPGVWAWHCHILNHAETPSGMKYMVTAIIAE